MRKIGRNEPCPCGSGKKFKHCHLGREEELWAIQTDTMKKERHPWAPGPIAEDDSLLGKEQA